MTPPSQPRASSAGTFGFAVVIALFLVIAGGSLFLVFSPEPKQKSLTAGQKRRELTKKELTVIAGNEANEADAQRELEEREQKAKAAQGEGLLAPEPAHATSKR